MRSHIRGFEIELNNDASLRVRRCFSSDDQEVVEISVEGGADALYTSVSACLTPSQAFTMAYQLQHEANVALEAS